ncbi:MAG: hypothetical protein COA50_01410 [Flavobacteriaceae bacterium]|nr:MAG: hypothetical protein COA50_01410 [Flavobacteriaceae bacterium]
MTKLSKKQQVFFLLYLLPFLIFSQAESIFNGIKLNESLQSVSEKISLISESSELITPNHPRFPLAKQKEEHLVCTTIKTSNGTIKKAVFTFSDNKLSYIEARGNVINTFISKRKDTSRNYMHYVVYSKDNLFVDKENDIAWIMVPEARHVNLFTWENPYLRNKNHSEPQESPSAKLPEFIKMGGTLNELKPGLVTNSAFTSVEELDGSDPNAQTQINCFGVNYLGFSRKFEARFGDDQLNTVWILTAKAEEERIREALVKTYGKADYINEDWEIFANWTIGLRKDKPEILLLTTEIGQFYKKELFKQ